MDALKKLLGYFLKDEASAKGAVYDAPLDAPQEIAAAPDMELSPVNVKVRARPLSPDEILRQKRRQRSENAQLASGITRAAAMPPVQRAQDRLSRLYARNPKLAKLDEELEEE